MALFEDKRKPVNIYAKGTPTERAQNVGGQAWKTTGQRLANVADRYAGGAGVRKLGQGVKSAAAASRVGQNYLQQKEKRDLRRNFVPVGDEASAIKPVRKNPVVRKPVDRGMASLSDGDRTYRKTISETGKAARNLLSNRGNPDGTASGDYTALKEQIQKDIFNKERNRALGINPDGSRRTGNMDVTFDPSVGREARAAFLRNPVAPVQRQRVQSRFIKPQYSWNQGENGSSGSGEINTFGDILRYKRQMADKRFAQGERKLNQVDRTISQDDARIAQGDRKLGQEDVSLGLEGRRVANVERGTDIYASRVESENALRDQQMQTGKLDYDRAKQRADLEAEFASQETSPDRKKQIENELYSLGLRQKPKMQIIQNKGVDPATNLPTLTNIAFDGQNFYPVGEINEAPPAAVQALINTTEDGSGLRAQRAREFKAKYGYLPPGFTS